MFGGEEEVLMEGRLGVAEAIASLRSELYMAMRDAAGQLVQFKVGAVDWSSRWRWAVRGRHGKVRFWIIEAGADGKVSSTPRRPEDRLERWTR